ncbi:FAD-binding protein [Aggregicoccus sp. 17bor-14]|uniref:D-arabinono-1,4-lactone oxidase n=1 Tax=Myxococcaceae TaxID=31 RepID=UPI0012F17B13|nr:FAD-binding protein [Simulacricoccus sp. 17bor-14]MRI91563.1 FAD-binding protein [Aggregicoccus sp. 17bor-14]
MSHGRAPWRNWSGSVVAHPAEVHRPDSLEALQQVVRGAAARGLCVRVAGSGHSFTPLVATDAVLLSLERLTGLERVDRERCEATVWAGTPLHVLGRLLAAEGLAMENLGDIDRQSLAGALSTGTHGTGLGFGSLSTQVVGLTLVTAQGELVECSGQERPELFKAAAVSLGSLGVIARVRLRLVPAFRLQCARRTESLERCLDTLLETARAHRHFEFFWFPHTDRVSVKALDVTEAPARGHGVGHRVKDLVLENAAFWLLSEAVRRKPARAAGASRLCARLAAEDRSVGASHRVFATPRHVRFQEMEYALPLEAGPAALRELSELVLRERVPVHFPVEFRLVKGDDLWLSPMHGRDSALVAVHQYRGMPYGDYFEQAEALLRRHGGRPHWGKLHTLEAHSLAPLYPRWEDFQRVRRELDPAGTFLNAHLRRLFGTLSG